MGTFMALRKLVRQQSDTCWAVFLPVASAVPHFHQLHRIGSLYYGPKSFLS